MSDRNIVNIIQSNPRIITIRAAGIQASGAGSGDVVGPASSTDNAIARYDGTTGKLLQNSAATIADTTGDITAGKYNTVTISGASTPNLSVTGTTTVSGANTGDQSLFSTIAVSGQSNVVADAVSDTLTLVAGTNITITTDASTDSVTITASGGSGNVTKVGTPVNNQIGVWTGDGTIEGDTNLQYDGTNLALGASKNLTIGGSAILADSSGTTTLSNIDALDSTTETTIEAAIDTLANLTSIQGQTLTMSAALTVAGTASVSGTNTGDQTSVSGNAGTVTFSDASGDTTCFVALGTAATGSLPVSTDAGITYNATTNALSTTTFIGALTGNADTVTTNANLTGHVTSVGNAAVLGSFTSAQLATALTDETGSGAAVFANSPTLVTPALGTPSSGVATNLTGTATSLNIGGNAATVTTNANLTGHVTSVGNAAVLGSFTSAQLSTALTDETGSGAAVFGTSPTLSAPNISGLAQLAENASISLDTTGSADGIYSGVTTEGTAGAALAFGDMIQYSNADSRWELCSVSAAAAAVGDCRGLVGACVLAAAGDGSATRILLLGKIRADANFPTLTIGGQCYLTTSGDITQTMPSNTDHVIRAIGFATTADEITFIPSTDWITRV